MSEISTRYLRIVSEVIAGVGWSRNSGQATPPTKQRLWSKKAHHDEPYEVVISTATLLHCHYAPYKRATPNYPQWILLSALLPILIYPRIRLVRLDLID